jgi:hypothetical protein
MEHVFCLKEFICHFFKLFKQTTKGVWVISLELDLRQKFVDVEVLIDLR